MSKVTITKSNIQLHISDKQQALPLIKKKELKTSNEVIIGGGGISRSIT